MYGSQPFERITHDMLNTEQRAHIFFARLIIYTSRTLSFLMVVQNSMRKEKINVDDDDGELIEH